jgi:DNA repair protein RecN (Recombination protein N)
VLETLRIKHIATIDSAEIGFKSGLNILSGETGAGKSIVIESISLILGSRANTDLIRTGCEEAVVEGLFDTSQISWIRERLERLGFVSNTPELLVKRIIHRAGRHRVYVNGELATLAILQNLCEGLVDLCGQHEHQSLLKSATQLELVDRYGGLIEQASSFAKSFSIMREISEELEILQAKEGERTKRADFLKFQIRELSEANLKPNEDSALHEEKKLLQSAESRVQCAEEVRQILEAEENSALGALRTSLNKLRTLSQLDERTVSLREGLERGLAETEEVCISVNRYLSSTDLNSERLLAVQERLALIADLRRKYGNTVEEMLSTLTDLERELSIIGQSNEKSGQLENHLKEVQIEVEKLGKKLSLARRKTSDLFSKSVTEELGDLKMGDAKFIIDFTAKDDLDSWGTSGPDAIQFLVQTNRGEPMRPLGKIASGGELSRLMLAVRRVIADRGGIGVYLFDEIDAGIGGQTAFQVGKKLKSVAQFNQVICITHLPQVASFADHHLSVRKFTQSKRTITEVVELGKPERKEELARMLAGPQLTKKSLENAAELIKLAR